MTTMAGGRDSRATARNRRGFTLVELLVVMAIIAVLAGMLLPAVQAARETARRTSCAGNMRQMALATHNYEAAFKMMPSGGEGTDYSTDPPSTRFDTQSVFTQILPYIEQASLYQQIDMRYSYRVDINAPAAKQEIPIFICPSNPWSTVADPQGFGQIDYFATVYTDIDPVTGLRANAAGSGNRRADGALCVPAAPMAAISDGTSNTILFIEDIGRTHPSVGFHTDSHYADPVCTGATGDLADDCAGTSNNRAVHRWADPDAGGSGVSGPPNASGDATTPWARFINQNSTPIGGTASCPWTSNNCGLNDEPFSMHPGGCNSVFADGSVHFLSERLDAATMRGLVTRSEGASVTVPK